MGCSSSKNNRTDFLDQGLVLFQSTDVEAPRRRDGSMAEAPGRRSKPIPFGGPSLGDGTRDRVISR